MKILYTKRLGKCNPIFMLLIVIVLNSFNGCTPTKVSSVPSVSSVSSSTPHKSKQRDSSNWQKTLRTSARIFYSVAERKHLKEMRVQYPIIINQFSDFYLYMNDRDTAIKASINDTVFSALAHTAHPPLAVYNILKADKFKVQENTIRILKGYKRTLLSTNNKIQKDPVLNEVQKARIDSIFDKTINYINDVVTNQQTTKQQFTDFAEEVRPLTIRNLDEGAEIQLEEQKKILYSWKQKYDKQEWKDLKVAIIGVHQPRKLNSSTLFFQWLLGEASFNTGYIEPEYEKNVVFVEFPPRPITTDTSDIGLSLSLLNKVEFEKEMSKILLGKTELLQQDALGPSAIKVLSTWGKSDWSR